MVNESLLIFGAVGAAVAHHKATLISAPLETLEQTETVAGLSVGGGMEFAFNDVVKARIEYLYDHYFNPRLFAQRRSPVFLTLFPNFRSEFGMHSVRAGITIDLN